MLAYCWKNISLLEDDVEALKDVSGGRGEVFVFVDKNIQATEKLRNFEGYGATRRGSQDEVQPLDPRCHQNSPTCVRCDVVRYCTAVNSGKWGAVLVRGDWSVSTCLALGRRGPFSAENPALLQATQNSCHQSW